MSEVVRLGEILPTVLRDIERRMLPEGLCIICNSQPGEKSGLCSDVITAVSYDDSGPHHKWRFLTLHTSRG